MPGEGGSTTSGKYGPNGIVVGGVRLGIESLATCPVWMLAGISLANLSTLLSTLLGSPLPLLVSEVLFGNIRFLLRGYSISGPRAV